MDIGELRYNYNLATYSPEKKSDDSSYSIDGYPDPYDQTPVNPNPVKPIVPDDSKDQTDGHSKTNDTVNDNGKIHPHTPFD